MGRRADIWLDDPWCRLVGDYEKRIDVSRAMILVAKGGNLLRRNTHPGFSERTLTTH
ncbi:hypothetical protein NOVOSPHI9U_130011 [Novosphingobium sp. 9U]|nr:hypothetical protein NOVOSPHI9U_130011 [Novosphingobium sp. 9U]